MSAVIIQIGERFREAHAPITVSNLLSWQGMLDAMRCLTVDAQNCRPPSQETTLTQADYSQAAVLVFERNHRYIKPGMAEEVRDLAITIAIARQAPAPV